MKNYRILITGVAGFIGYHTALKLTTSGHSVLGLDCLNDYYDVDLKKSRVFDLQSQLKSKNLEVSFKFHPLDINSPQIDELWKEFKPEIVIHLAAQAGVRYSIEAPEKYLDANVEGFFKLIELARKFPVRHFLYASSSSVYGNSQPGSMQDPARVAHQISFYGATKRANEIFAGTYSHLYKIPITGLRFFTVYGSWGRPDMAYFKFTEAILKGAEIPVYDYENQTRDFTHISDIVNSIHRVIDLPPASGGQAVQPNTFHRILDIGAKSPIRLREFLETLENVIGKKAKIQHLPAQPGDVSHTLADTKLLELLTNYHPQVSLRDGLQEFFSWYKTWKK